MSCKKIRKLILEQEGKQNEGEAINRISEAINKREANEIARIKWKNGKPGKIKAAK